jgi:hypothetical protein
VANFARTGWTQAEISRHTNIPQVVDSRDLAAVREFSVYDFEEVRIARFQQSRLMTFIAQSADVSAPKGPVCATREFLEELDASLSWVKVCSGFWSIFRVAALSLRGIGRRDATIGATRRSSERAKLSTSSRILKKLRKSAMKKC